MKHANLGGVGHVKKTMVPIKNPTPEQIHAVIAASEHRCAKWLKNLETGEIYCWPAEQAQHAHVAERYGVASFTKGFYTDD